MPTRQNRLPGVKWGEYSNRPQRSSRPRPEPISGDPNPAHPQEPGVAGGHPSLSGSQFNRIDVKNAMVRGVRAHTRAQYFRHAGMGAAIRHTLGIEQVPSHVTDYINAQQRMAGQRQNPITVAVDPRKPWEPWGEADATKEPEA